MESDLVERLININEFSDELSNILTAILRDIQRNIWDSYLNKLTVTLVNLTCHTRITCMKKHPIPTIQINNVNKTFQDYCLDIILQILLKIIK